MIQLLIYSKYGEKILSKRIIPNDLFFEQVKERLNAGQKVKIPVAGKSMEPFCKTGIWLY